MTNAFVAFLIQVCSVSPQHHAYKHIVDPSPKEYTSAGQPVSSSLLGLHICETRQDASAVPKCCLQMLKGMLEGLFDAY